MYKTITFFLQTLYNSSQYDIMERIFPFSEGEYLCSSINPIVFVSSQLKQIELIKKTIGCSRFVFNHFLATWKDTYKETGKGLTYHTCSSKLPSLKNEYAWLKEVDSIALQSSLKNLA